jgi:hypothetical protein
MANLVRNTASGNYYARVRLKSKLIWKSLKTDRLAVAKLRLEAKDLKAAREVFKPLNVSLIKQCASHFLNG